MGYVHRIELKIWHNIKTLKWKIAFEGSKNSLAGRVWHGKLIKWLLGNVGEIGTSVVWCVLAVSWNIIYDVAHNLPKRHHICPS